MLKVIIIDDEKLIRDGLRSLINWDELGFMVCDEGKDGKDGLEKILQHNPDLVLVDFRMPGINGIQVIKEARINNFKGHFILITGYTEAEIAQTALTLDIKQYLLKPIDDEELLKIVQEVLKEINVESTD